jgi:hygromycin-B 7''-O-kinase
MQLFPQIDSDEDFAAWRSNPTGWLSSVRLIAARHRLSAATCRPFATGTNLVVEIDNGIILKIYPPLYRRQFEVEHRTLAELAGKLHVAVPEIVAIGDIYGWTYLMMTKLDGVVGSTVWPELAENEKETVLAGIGATIADVQSVAPGRIGEVPPAWPDFMTGRIAECRAWHVGRGLEERFLDDLDEIVSGVGIFLHPQQPAAILTGEYIPENFLLAQTNGRWSVAGLFDFGDVMTGPAEYDLLGPSAFMAAGRPQRMAHFLQGYGYSLSDIDTEWKEKLFTLMLLHRASDLRNVAISGWQQKIVHLRDLAELIWQIER